MTSPIPTSKTLNLRLDEPALRHKIDVAMPEPRRNSGETALKRLRLGI